jgi:GAF domain-containing protein
LATKNRKKRHEKGAPGRFQDILEVTRLLSSSIVPEKVIETVLIHLCDRLGKRARCALLEGEDLLRFFAGPHTCPVEGLKIDKKSIVWDAVRKGTPFNLVNEHATEGYKHTLSTPINIKSIIPLSYFDPITQQERKLGALIVDSGQEHVPISTEDFEYLQVIGQLISAVVGRSDLIRQLMTSCRRQEAILVETVHNFRNSIAVIGGFSRRIAKLADNAETAEKARHLEEEVKVLEAHVAEFEKYMNAPT